jgi:hypothetical protein
MKDSYEGNMMLKWAMPTRQEVEKELLKTLFRHNGVVKEFSTGEDIVDEIANEFSLNEKQREVVLERIYRKENRIVKTPLWHRLLFRAADSLAKEKCVTKPTTTLLLTNKKEWMLTEKGYDEVLETLHIPLLKKEVLPVKSYEVQKELKKIIETPLPKNYNPFETKKKVVVTKETSIRSRGFRQAVIGTYDYKCCVCGLKLTAPNILNWEVEAAHIIPHGVGKDDIWNGIALCHLHHWAFDVGWFSLTNDYKIIISSQSKKIPDNFGKIDNYDFFRNSLVENKSIILPENSALYPHKISIEWHRNKIFYS